ncbi:hypothetical protein BBJ28_00014556 [Nothophytophthora sp. Chile5]|nr:hypothetical protein BBJ28_00014556 [Nothophytophthora sp. Chile5]
MAAQIAEPTNASMSFNEEVLSPVSKLEAARKAAAADQQKRIDQAVARMASQKKENMGKRKVLEARLDGHRNKVQKTKTVVDVAQEQGGKKNSIARRLVDRFASDPEPEQEEPVRLLNDTVEVTKVTTTTTTTTTAEEESAVVSQEEDAEVAEESADWNGPTTNFHLKQLGLDDKVDIYAPMKVQQQEVRRIRERAMYLPEPKSIATLETASDSENDSDFLPKDAEEEDEDSDAESLPAVDGEEARALAEESEEYEQTVAAEAAAARLTLVKRVFVWTPLCVLAFVALVFAILFAIDWSQETFQFCPVDADSVDGSEELLSCASFVETQSLIKTSVREALEKAQSTVQSYLE